MKIAVFINNTNITDIDCSSLINGNPGIGGTEYCLLLLCEMYKKYYPEDSFIIIATKSSKLPKVDNVVIIDNINEVAPICKKSNIDILVISAVEDGKPLSDKFLKSIEQNKLKTITWGHNFYLSDFATKLANNRYIAANVFVGRQQYDRYIDHSLIFKSTYIFNMYPTAARPIPRINDSRTVSYIGSLVYHKGFHILAQSWKDILAEVPDAKLLVIGSGKLYNRSSKLGRFKIANEDYENLFMRHLTHKDGKILESVNFLGILGEEKKRIIAETSVGVVNPSGRTETFGISALDFESQGVPVVTIAMGGFLDTVINKQTGLLYKKKKELASCVIKLLKQPNINMEYGNNGMEFAKFFSPDRLIIQWHDLFEMVMCGKLPLFHMPDNFYSNQLKGVRVLNRKIKNSLNLQALPAIVSYETIAKKIINKVRL